MNDYIRHLRIFIASPGDVSQERNIAIQVVDQLQYDPMIRGKISLETIAWDKPNAGTPMLAIMPPQEAIKKGLPKPSDCAIVVVIFWSRMGTPLPPEYKKPSGERYLSGTEWEYLNALQAAEKYGSPIVVVYRRTEQVAFSPSDLEFDSKVKQWRLVDDFFKEFVNPEDGSIKQGYNVYDNPEEFRQALEYDLRQLIKQYLEEVSLPSNISPKKDVEVWNTSPFPGLRAFTIEDAPIFFGRGRETGDLVKRVFTNRFVAVVGASGSGKSSLVAAGLLVQLEKNAIEGSKNWLVIRFAPGEESDNPFLALASKLPSHIRGSSEALAIDLENNTTVLIDVAQKMLAKQPRWAEVLLFIDQFEEIFTIVHKRYLTPFIEMMTNALNSGYFRIVITMRSDFYQRCVDIPGLAELLKEGSYPLPVPSQLELYQMITRPAERAALAFESGLPNQILHDTGDDAGALALMAYVLDELYRSRGDNTILTLEMYSDLGGVQGAIGKRAEKTFTELEKEAQATFTRVFRELVEVDERGIATRQRANVEKIVTNDQSSTFVNAFIDARLLVTHRGIVEVAHEALLRSWVRLTKWIENMQGDLRLLRQVQTAANDWDRHGRRKDYLWSHERLIPVYEMIDRLEVPAESPLQDFIRPEHEWLLEELNDPNTLDYRRQAIGDRLAQIGAPALPGLSEVFFHPDKWLRAVAVKALINIGETAIPFLIFTLQQEADMLSVGRAARALSAIGNPSIPSLIQLVSDESLRKKYYYYYAAEALRNIKDPRGLYALAEAYQNPLLRNEADTALRNISYEILRIKDYQMIAFLVEVQDYKGPYSEVIKKNAISALTNIQNSSAIPALIEALSSSVIEVHLAIINALGNIRDHRILVPLIDELGHKNTDVRHKAIVVLSQIGDSSAAKSIINLLSDSDLNIQKTAMDALIEMGDSVVVDALIDELGHENPVVRYNAIIVLSQIGDPRAAKPIINLLRNSDLNIQKTAMVALNDIGNSFVVNSLIGALQHENPTIRHNAIIVLSQIGDSDGLLSFINFMNNNSLDIEETIISTLIEALSDKDSNIRRAIASMLGEIGNSRAEEPLTRLLDDHIPLVRETAVTALRKINNNKLATITSADLGIAAHIDPLNWLEGIAAQPGATKREPSNFIKIDGFDPFDDLPIISADDLQWLDELMRFPPIPENLKKNEEEITNNTSLDSPPDWLKSILTDEEDSNNDHDAWLGI